MGRNALHVFILILIIVLVSAAVRVVHDQWFPRRPDIHHIRPDLHMEFVRDELDLTDDQTERFEAMIDSFANQTRPIRDSLHEKRMALFDEMSSEQPSLDVLDELAEDIGALEIKLKKRTMRHMLERDDVLTPEQKEKLFSVFRERQARMDPHGPRHTPMGKGFGRPHRESGE